MKKINLMLFLLVSAAAVFLFGCNKTKAPDESNQSPETQTSEITPTKAPEGESEDKEDEIRSYLTGKVTDPAIARRRPVAIMLNNLEAAQPMCGISRADVVYECVVEGSITRLMGIFENYDDLEKIGSVRSCRSYFVYCALEFDAIYAHYGQAAYAVELLDADYVDNLSGLSEIGSTVFYRTPDRQAPHNAYASAEGIKAGIKKMGYDENYRASYKGKFLFAEDGKENTNEDGANATYVAPGYLINQPWFEYNEQDKKYYRFQYGGPQIDEMLTEQNEKTNDQKEKVNEQISYDNIVLQYCKWVQLDKNDYLAFDCHSGGAMKYITEGKVVDGFWSRTVEDESCGNHDEGVTRYYDSTGKEIVFNQGKTWICMIQDTKADKVEIK